MMKRTEWLQETRKMRCTEAYWGWLAVTERYRERHFGWNVKHFYGWYRREGGGRSYGWVKDTLQGAG
ncbi:MAG: hypothetical protein ACREUD_03430 [Gammaproteobacteria bacterium]